MDFVNKLASKATGEHQQGDQAQKPSGGDGLMDKFNNLAGGGAKGEQKEDGLDKGIDWVQEKVFKQGPQDNESAAEQATDKFIADQIRNQYKNATGRDFPIADKE
ncbi:uncharacterized protein C8A04DRAFT_26225 [Dichotomopilus funicola]|uniref:DNA damage-responsive protein 48 n=1 Tax=Dichotomopilus funicola TaxID=1934379 RepID=A0AAN6ZQ16_9PEZI|nr:hypothetical protein C8A04DRAFT_26225 [Dichotomopilus funicola]